MQERAEAAELEARKKMASAQQRMQDVQNKAEQLEAANAKLQDEVEEVGQGKALWGYKGY